MIRSEFLVHEINKLDLTHRKGWKHSEVQKEPLDARYIGIELKELIDAVDELYELGPRTSFQEIDRCKEHVKEETADVFICLMQLIYRMGWSFEDINEESVRKLRLRFLGADAIQIPGELNATLSPVTSLHSHSLLPTWPHGKRSLRSRGVPCS